MYKFKRFFLISVSLLLFSCGSEKKADDFDVWGLDVSRHQRDIDWKRLIEHEKPYFVFLKATEGTMIADPTYEKHRRELTDEDVLWGAYHFFGHRTPGKEQARNFIKTAKLEKGNILPVLDIEKHRFMTDPRKSVKEALAFCREIKGHYGKYPIIYCSTNFYNSYLKKDFKPGKYILWIADYRGAAPELDWTMWQHTETHKIKGIKGAVDRNVFSGSADDLRKLTL